MPVSLIPQQRPTRRSLGESLKALTGGDFFVGLSLFVLLIVVVSYLGLTLYQSRLNAALQKDNEDYANLQQTRPIKDQTQAIDFAKRAQRIKTLLASHVNIDPLFSFLENYTHRSATWTNLAFDSRKGELKLGGSVNGYQSLAEQMVLWQKNPVVLHVSVSDFKLGNDGLLHFSADLLLSPGTFMPSSS